MEDGAAGASPPGGAKYRARRFALTFEPPCVFLEYEETSQAVPKRRVRAVKLSKIQPTTDVDKLARKVIRSFPRKLDATTLKYEQVRKLVAKLVEAAQGHPSAAAPAQKAAAVGGAAKAAPSGAAAANGDARKGVVAVSAANSSGHSHSFDMNSALKELDDDMGAPTTSGSLRPSSAAPKPAPAAGPGPGSRQGAGSPGASPKPTGGTGAGKSRFAQEAEEEEGQLVLDVAIDGDLNRVSELELKMAKERMDQAYSKNRILPGDPRYEYDKQVDFKAMEKNEWDDSDDEDQGPEEEDDDDVQVDWQEIHAAVSKKDAAAASGGGVSAGAAARGKGPVLVHAGASEDGSDCFSDDGGLELPDDS